MRWEQKAVGRNLRLMEEKVSKWERKEIREKYAGEQDVIPERQKLLVAKAHRLAMKVIDNGGTEEEVHLALQHLAMCLDSVNYKMDWKRYKQEKDIQGRLIDKYKEYSIGNSRRVFET